MAASFTYKSLMSLVACSVRGTIGSRTAGRVTARSFRTSGTASTDTGGKDAQPTQDPVSTTQRDPFPVFMDQKVQQILTRVTGFDPLKVAGPHKVPLKSPKYKLLTDKELEKELETAHNRLKERLQIPPYMNPRTDDQQPLSVDPDLAGFDTSKYVFTDVSFGIVDRQRNVVIREPDGTLRVAPWEVKERMNHIYHPREGKEYFKPAMFQEQNLERMISEKRYLYILDRACCQLEPDDPDYVRITHRVYNAVNTAQDFELLRSTRHFGSLAFYLAWYHMIDHLLLDTIKRDLLSDSQDLVCLYCIIHPGSKCAVVVNMLGQVEPSAVIKAYIETDSKHKDQLELALQAAQDARRNMKSKGSLKA